MAEKTEKAWEPKVETQEEDEMARLQAALLDLKEAWGSDSRGSEDIDSYQIVFEDEIENKGSFYDQAVLAYNNGNYAKAEELLLKGVRLASDRPADLMVYKGHLASMIRRRETVKEYPRSDVPKLLLDGVKRRDAFSIINMALFWIMESGTDEDWELADRLIPFIDNNDIDLQSLLSHWKHCGIAGEVEGFIAVLLLMRHGKVAKTDLGDANTLFLRIRHDYPGVPERFREVLVPFDPGRTSEFPDSWQ